MTQQRDAYLRVLESLMPASECSLDGLGGRINLAYARGRTQGATRVLLSRRLNLMTSMKEGQRTHPQR